MPAISSLVGPFEGFRDQARAAGRSAQAEASALSAERVRILHDVADRLSVRLRARAPDVEGLHALGVLPELGLSPGDVLDSLAAEREAARTAFGQAQDRRRQVEAAFRPVEETDRRRREEIRRLRGEAADAAREAAAFDPDFLRAHAVVAPEGGAPVSDASLRSPFAFVTRIFAERQGRAIDAVAEYERGGASYARTRDERYLPIAARGREATRKAEALERDPGHESAKADVARRRLAAAEDAADLAEDRMDEADRRAEAPHAAVMAEIPAWFAGLVASFDRRASSRRPEGPDPLGRLWSEGLLDGADLAALAHRLALGRAADAMERRAKALRGMEDRFEKDLSKLRRARGNGAGSRQVSIDVSSIEKAMAANIAAQDAAAAASARRRSPAAAGAAAAVGRDVLLDVVEPYLLQWVAVLAAGSEDELGGLRAWSSGDAAIPGERTDGPPPLPSLDAAAIPDLPGLEGLSVPAVDMPAVSLPDLPSFSVPDTPAPASATTDWGGGDYGGYSP